MKKYLKENMSHDDILAFCVDKLQLEAKDVEIEADGTVNVKDNIYIFDNHLLEGGHLPFKFGKVAGAFDTGSAKSLSSLRNFPHYVGKRLKIHDTPNLKSIDGLPEYVGLDLYIHSSGITSLVGISDYLKECKGKIKADFEKIKEGGLGLLQVKGITALEQNGGQLPKPFLIISGYLGRPDDVFDCQAELIDAGFEDFAQL